MKGIIYQTERYYLSTMKGITLRQTQGESIKQRDSIIRQTQSL